MLNCPSNVLSAMEGRVSRGRGGSWKRGGRGRNEGESSGSEHRGRGRGGQNRGRNKHDHHRGRGRGAFFHQRPHDEGDPLEEEDDKPETFTSRKLESNWDRYEASEKQKPDDEMPTRRGTDFHVLLESAGDSFTQFRFSEEKDWEKNQFTASEMSVVPLDLPALAQLLQQLPLTQRLYLDDDLVQVSTPVELPATPIVSKPETISKTSSFAAPSAAFRNPSTNQTPTSGSDSTVFPVATDDDEELEQLLSLRKGLPCAEVEQLDDGATPNAPETSCEEAKLEEEEGKKDVSLSKPVTVKQEMSEEDLEDWLDSMIS
ncbi:cell death regulator Aven [Gouania willdenowi]|uniref:Cell death regulator Aven n=1 Tax=Gouania willdenowi TaxID=441366 RepID=A0A8C5DFN7_GOUWI|nr:cell death regulator Aven [Gouania willdenowi]